MRKYAMFKNVIIATLFALLSLGGCATASDPAIYLVRHAEKEPGRDPNLTPVGKVRAEALITHLDGVALDAIYSTDYRRTRQTAAPISLKTGVPVLRYDPAKLGEFADQLRAQGGTVLVVGHSNTTPELVAALGGEAGAPITEATEYDRLYVLTFVDGEVQTLIERYGEPTPR